MTTKVTIAANHGWPVRVVKIDQDGQEMKEIVPAGETRDIYIHSTLDLHVHEIQPGEEH